MATIALHVGFLAVAAAWLWATVVAMRGIVATPLLPESGTSAEEPAPRVAIIAPARDEAKRIEATIRRFLAQRGVDLRVIVVDDRSTDGTTAILEGLAAEDERLEVARVEALPAGWLGKCHACHVGATRALAWEGVEWLLFSDADTWLTDRAVARAVAHVRREGAEHLFLIPGFAETTLIGKAALAAAMQGFMKLAGGVNRDRPLAYVGGGAFNLTTADAYRRSDGHTALRMEIVDDVRLGFVLKRCGARSRAAIAPLDVEVEWIADARGFVRLLEKNYFSLLDFSAVRAGGAVAGVLAGWAAGPLGAASGMWSGWAAAGAMAAFAAPCAITARRMGWPVWIGLLSPLTLPLFALAMFNSATKTLWRGGVRWRETFYPLKDLRAGMVR